MDSLPASGRFTLGVDSLDAAVLVKSTLVFRARVDSPELRVVSQVDDVVDPRTRG